MTSIRALAAILCVTAIAACEKNAVQSIAAPASGAFIRFQNYGVNVPGVNFYANEQKLTAISTANCTPPTAAACTSTGIESTTGVAYGVSANAGNYSMVTPGQYKLTGRLAALTDNGLAVASVDASLADGKYYSYYVSGIYNASTKSSDAFLVEDALPTTFDYTKAYLRIINASPNAPAISVAIALPGATTPISVASGLAYKSASPIVTAAPGTYDIAIGFNNGGLTTFTGFPMIGGHVLTVTLRGDATSTSATTGLALSVSYNR
ncbi:MAG: DUF4397 domain-containing protein [bacterium]